MVGLDRIELSTSRLSGVRSNHLSYRPIPSYGPSQVSLRRSCVEEVTLAIYCDFFGAKLLRKEVIQPQVPLRLPCYDFTPVADPTVVGCPLKVSAPASGKTNSHGVTGGVYKARERIHRDIADSRLLAIPTSWSRVADSNPDYETFCGIRSSSRLHRPLCVPL